MPPPSHRLQVATGIIGTKVAITVCAAVRRCLSRRLSLMLIAITTALVSVFTGIPVRADIAMTGEITLRGEVLPIGGLKEKLLAAHRGGIKLVLIPEENVKDLIDIPDNVKNAIEIVPVRWIDKVLELALERKPEALPDPSPEELAKKAAEAAKQTASTATGDVIKH